VTVIELPGALHACDLLVGDPLGPRGHQDPSLGALARLRRGDHVDRPTCLAQIRGALPELPADTTLLRPEIVVDRPRQRAVTLLPGALPALHDLGADRLEELVRRHDLLRDRRLRP